MVSPRVRNFLERRAGRLVDGYRVLRDEWVLGTQTARRTPMGFYVAGSPAMQDGTFEAAERALVETLLPHIDVFVDVGANAGYYTGVARHAGRSVIAIEPLQSNLRLLYRNLEANGWNDVEVWPVALSDHPGTADLFGTGTGASLVPGWSGGSLHHRRRVPLALLDHVLNNRFEGRRLFIKVDVEGAEAEMLAGAVQVLARSPRPIWLVEAVLDQHHPHGNRRFEEVFQRFWQSGYHAVAADGDRRPVTPADVQRWVQSGHPDFGSHNWLFAADPTLLPRVPR